MFKKIENKLWLITYQVKAGKIIEVLFSAKDGNLIGWCQRTLFLKNRGAV